MEFKEYVDEKLALKQMKEQEMDRSFNTIKFSINVDEVTNRRLKYVADQLEVTRAEFCRDIIKMALLDVERQLGLDAFNFDSEYANKLYEGLEEVPLADDYGKLLMSLPKADFIKMIRESRGEVNE